MEDGSLPPAVTQGITEEYAEFGPLAFQFGKEETFPVKGPHGTEIGRGRIIQAIPGAVGIMIEVELNPENTLGKFYQETILDMSMSLHSKVHNAGKEGEKDGSQS